MANFLFSGGVGLCARLPVVHALYCNFTHQVPGMRLCPRGAAGFLY